MEIKIRIKTPKGHAKKTSRKIKPFLLGVSKQPKVFKVNKDDSQITWVVEGTPRQIKKIERNVTRYEIMITMLLNNKVAKKSLHKYLDPESKKELHDMLINQTEVSVLKGNLAEL